MYLNIRWTDNWKNGTFLKKINKYKTQGGLYYKQGGLYYKPEMLSGTYAQQGLSDRLQADLAMLLGFRSHPTAVPKSEARQYS